MIKIKQNIVLIIFAFLLIYYPPIMPINMLHLLALFSYVYLFNNIAYWSNKYLLHKYINIVSSFLLLTIWLLVVCVIQGNTLGIVAGYIQIITEVIPAAFSVGIYCYKHDFSKKDFLDILLIVGCIQGILSLLTFMVPEIQSSILNQAISYGFDSQKYASFLGRRYFGLAYNLVTYVPVLQSFLAVVALRRALIEKLRYLWMVLILTFSAVINGRSALVILFIGVLMILIEQFKTIKIARYVKLILTGIIVIIVFTQLYQALEVMSPRTYSWLTQGIDEIKQLIFEGETGTYFSTLSNISDIIPKGIDFIVGVGETSIGGNTRGVASDIGYINYLWMGGIFFFIFIHAVFIFMIYKIWKKSKADQTYRFISIYFLFTVIVYNIKMPIFLLNEMTIVIILVYSFCIINQGISRVN